MSAFSDYMEDKIINWSLRNTSAGTAPTTVYISAHTGAPGEDNAGANEVSGNNYGRAAVSTSGGFSAPSGGATSNAANIEFAQASGSWGTITHFAIWDAVTTGNQLYNGALTASKAIGSGDVLRFLAGDLDITVA